MGWITYDVCRSSNWMVIHPGTDRHLRLHPKMPKIQEEITPFILGKVLSCKVTLSPIVLVGICSGRNTVGPKTGSRCNHHSSDS